MIYIDGVIFSLQRAGGISVYFNQLLRYLRSSNVPATLLVDNNNLQVNELAEVGLSQVIKSARLLERYRKCRLPGDAAIFHSSYYRLPERRNVPTVITVYDFIYEHFSKGQRRWVHSAQKNAAIRSAQEIICISNSTKADLLDFVGEIPGQTIHVIHCGVSEIFRQLSSKKVSAPYVLFVGQRSGYKNFKIVLDAMAFLPDIELHCVGGGPLHPRELIGAQDSVIKRTKHLGFVDDEKLNSIYNNAVCLAYPSSYEGFGIPVIEAMRAGCPVVSADCRAVIEIGREALIVVRELDPESMAAAILRTLSSERLNLINKGLLVAQNYSWHKAHSQTLEVYRRLVA